MDVDLRMNDELQWGNENDDDCGKEGSDRGECSGTIASLLETGERPVELLLLEVAASEDAQLELVAETGSKEEQHGVEIWWGWKLCKIVSRKHGDNRQKQALRDSLLLFWSKLKIDVVTLLTILICLEQEQDVIVSVALQVIFDTSEESVVLFSMFKQVGDVYLSCETMTVDGELVFDVLEIVDFWGRHEREPCELYVIKDEEEHGLSGGCEDKGSEELEEEKGECGQIVSEEEKRLSEWHEHEAELDGRRGKDFEYLPEEQEQILEVTVSKWRSSTVTRSISDDEWEKKMSETEEEK